MFLNAKSKTQSEKLLITKTGSEIDIITIAFNNPLLIEYQIKLIQKNVTDRFTHIIADNSNDEDIKKSIFEVCKQLNVLYVSIPSHKHRMHDSHAAALHWTYKNVIRKRKRKYFGFLDHDIFPVHRCSIVEKFSNNIYGRVVGTYSGPERQLKPVSREHPHWCLWAGFCFFKSDLLNRINVYKLNFFRKILQDGILDTGGGLWDTVYNQLPYQKDLINFRYVRYRHYGDYHSDFYECLDDWIHIMSASEWRATSNMQEKMEYFEKWMKEIIET